MGAGAAVPPRLLRFAGVPGSAVPLVSAVTGCPGRFYSPAATPDGVRLGFFRRLTGDSRIYAMFPFTIRQAARR